MNSLSRIMILPLMMFLVGGCNSDTSSEPARTTVTEVPNPPIPDVPVQVELSDEGRVLQLVLSQDKGVEP